MRSFRNWQRDTRLKGLNPVLMNNLLRVGGRLSNAQIDFDAKLPIIIASNKKLARFLVEHYHMVAGHSGWAEILTKLRDSFWLMKGRCAVKRVLRDCVNCRKYNVRPAQQLMAPLPVEHMTADKPPFSFTSVKYFGPISVRQG